VFPDCSTQIWGWAASTLSEVVMPDLGCVWFSAPHIPAGGVQGVLYAASPLNSCSPLTNHTEKGLPSAAFALVARGSCNFDVKVKNVQDAGFAAAIVFDTEDGFDELVTSMSLSTSVLHLSPIALGN
jgi:hypothetical protein